MAGSYIFVQQILTLLVLIFIIMSANAQEVNKAMKITSQSFENQKDMAKKITCDGEDISPALE